MSPDAVQYARALRPPYHLLSFLRIKGHSTKGMSCTDKNTMVSGSKLIKHQQMISMYNLINQNAREAELSLISSI